MFSRLVLPTLLIALGICSPWLVQDWLGEKKDRAEPGRVYTALSSIPDKVRDAFKKTPKQETTGSSRRPYPVESGEERAPAGLAFPSFPLRTERGDSIPTTDQSRTITKETLDKLLPDLEQLKLAVGNEVFLRIFKEEGELELWMQPSGEPKFKLFRVYTLKDWAGRLGPKLREGDNQCPEGFYYASASSLRPDTRHHLGIDLSFPNAYDAHHGRSGGGLLIHGGQRSGGSFVLDQSDMNEVYTLATVALENGHPILKVNIFPFRMDDKRMELEWNRQSEWIDFWLNLKQGYDFFENVNYPPNAEVERGEYTFLLR